MSPWLPSHLLHYRRKCTARGTPGMHQSIHKKLSDLPVHKAAFRYLKQKLQLGHPTSPNMQLTSGGQFLGANYIEHIRELYCILPQDVNFDNCSCHLYIDDCRRLQVSIVRFFINRIWFSMMQMFLVLRNLWSVELTWILFSCSLSCLCMTQMQWRMLYCLMGLNQMGIRSTKKYIYLRYIVI